MVFSLRQLCPDTVNCYSTHFESVTKQKFMHLQTNFVFDKQKLKSENQKRVQKIFENRIRNFIKPRHKHKFSIFWKSHIYTNEKVHVIY
jgi:hypothetical protein